MGGLRATILAGLVLSLASRSFAAFRTSVKFNNNKLPGDRQSTDGSYELISSSFSLGQAVSKTNTGFQTGVPSQGAVVLTKLGDEWDPTFEYFELASVQAARLSNVVISTVRLSGERSVPVFDIQLTNAYITSNEFTMTGGNEETYSISLNYETITVINYNTRGGSTVKTQTSYNFLQKRAT
ncbi:g3346 [Coccomyxa elongata]